MIFVSVGDITKNVKISDKPIMTWLGGKLGVPIACRVRVRTITILTNAVVIMTILGAKVKIVSKIRT